MFSIFWSNNINYPWHDSLSSSQSLQKMIHNQQKAVNEHAKLSPVFASATQALPTPKALSEKEITPLKFSHHFADSIGPRPTMEDAHFTIEIEQGTLAGVFDGHGGRQIPDYASQEFQKRFSAVLKESDGNVLKAFERLIHEIHQEVAEKPEWSNHGSTAVICFIDKETSQIYTATLGDSEANIYREVDGSPISIPLSLVRDWTDKKDAARLEKAMGLPSGHVAGRLKSGADPKEIRLCLNFPAKTAIKERRGINVSRAIGDIHSTGTKDKPGIIHKPKITVNKLQKGDLVILACDGLKDYAPEHEIIDTILYSKAWTICNIVRWIFRFIASWITWSHQKGVAQDLVNYAVNTKSAQDNVTVIAIEAS